MNLTSQLEELTSRSERYELLKRFSMPTTHGSMDAVSVTARYGQVLQTVYALILQAIILQIWSLVVLFGIAIAAKDRRLTHNMAAANVAIWNTQSSPLNVVKEMLDYYIHMPRYALMWAFLALAAWAGSVSLSSFVSPSIIIGQAAPVNPDAVFVPTFIDTPTGSFYYQTLALTAPANLRAIDALEMISSPTGKLDDVSNGHVNINKIAVPMAANNAMFYNITYSYSVTGVDFGLQHAPDLLHSVDGACYTEYGWYVNGNNSDGNSTDTYRLFDDPMNLINVSKADGKPPLVNVWPDPKTNPSSPNKTFAFVISSVGRRSFSAGNDPWYLTKDLSYDASGAKHVVSSARPVLSCWQRDIWSYKGNNTSIEEIDTLKALSPALVATMKRYLSIPRIIPLTQALGSSALAATSLGHYFDASVASVEEDLKRLILGSYVATKNTLLETTQYNATQVSDIASALKDSQTGDLLPGSGDFVIYHPDFAALSVRALIIIPTIMLSLSILVYLLSENTRIPLPWAYVNALKASVLYSNIDTKAFKTDDDAEWTRSLCPYYEGNDPALVRPKYDRESGSYSWHSLPDEARIRKQSLIEREYIERMSDEMDPDIV